MASPYGQDLHIDVPLTNVSIAYKQSTDKFIAHKIFPTVSVKHKSDIYYRYSKSDFRRTDVEQRAPGTRVPLTGWSHTTDTFYTTNYAIGHSIDDQDRANADSMWNLEREATERNTQMMLLKRDQQWANAFFKPGVWGTDLTGTATGSGVGEIVKWSNAAANIVAQMDEWKENFELENAGYAPNKLVVGPSVMRALRQNADIIERIKYTNSEGGFINDQLIGKLLGVELVQVRTSHTNVPRMLDAYDQDQAANYQWTFAPNDALLVYTPSAPTLRAPAAGYIFEWSSYPGGSGDSFKAFRYRDEPTRSDVLGLEASWDMKVVGKDLGLFVKDLV